MPETPEAMLATLLAVVQRSPLAVLLGIRPIRCWGGECELVLPIRADLTQHHGQVHGGVLGIVADNACAWAAASLVGDLVTNNYSVHMLAPAQGHTLRGVGTVIRVGKRSVTARADVYADGSGPAVLVATALASLTVVTARPESS